MPRKRMGAWASSQRLTKLILFMFKGSCFTVAGGGRGGQEAAGFERQEQEEE